MVKMRWLFIPVITSLFLLYLRGYGAGAAVTAAGVFGDVMRTLGWQQEM